MLQMLRTAQFGKKKTVISFAGLAKPGRVNDLALIGTA